MTKYVWDTTTFSDLAKGNENTRQHYKRVAPDQVMISVITVAELAYGFEKQPEAKRRYQIVTELLKTIAVLPWTLRLASFYAKLRHESTKQGVIVAANDLVIATHAYAKGHTPVTSDTALLRLTPWIRIENWRQ